MADIGNEPLVPAEHPRHMGEAEVIDGVDAPRQMVAFDDDTAYRRMNAMIVGRAEIEHEAEPVPVYFARGLPPSSSSIV